jgi:cytochrome c-type biogenesis protein CcmH/NrfG
LATGRSGPEWIRRWSWLRLADIAVALGHGSEARRALETAMRDAPAFDLEFGRYADRVRRDADALTTRR